MDNYRVIGRLGEGAHGLVIRATHMHSGKEVAIKKLIKHITSQQDNLICNLREVKAMQQVNHKHVVRLLDVIPVSGGVGLVMEFMSSSLAAIISDPDWPLEEPLIKAYFIMILLGVEFMHGQSVMHRDLKPANLLISSEGVLKIGDFGLARVFHEDERPYSHQVATRWYRAPELLWGAREYTESIDMWSVGCILGEMITRSPLFPGLTDIEQLSLVVRMLGSPNLANWPEVTTLPDYNKITFTDCKSLPFEVIVPGASQLALDVITKLLEYNPSNRLTASQTLATEYLWSDPLPQQLNKMPSPQKFQKPTKHNTIFQELRNILENT